MNKKEKSKFFDKFPGLEGKRIDVPDCQKCSEGLAFLSKDVEKNCVDKTIAKRCIDMILLGDNYSTRVSIYRALGIEDGI